MPPRSTLALALCACIGIAGPAAAQNFQAMRERFGIPLVASPKWGDYTLVSIAPDGKAVKKGDIVFQLKSPSLDARLDELKQKLEIAKGEHASARLDREVAELRLREFVGGTKREEMEEISGAVFLAEQAHKAAKEKLAAAKRLATKPDDPSISAALQVEVSKAGFASERAMTKRKVLEEFTHPRRQKEFEAALEKAKLAEFRLHAVVIVTKADLDKLEEEASTVLTVHAPEDGVVRFMSPRGLGGMPPGPGVNTRLKAGDTVRNGFPVLVLHPTEKEPEASKEKAKDKAEEKK